MIKETGLNRVKGKLAGSGGSVSCYSKTLPLLCAILFTCAPLFAQKNQPNIYCPTGEPPALGSFEADTAWGYYKNGTLALKVKYTPDTLPILICPVSKSRITHQQIYYKNGQLCFFESPDSLVSYTKKGRRKLFMQRDSVVVYRRNGTPMLACNDSHRVYLNASGKPVFERFHDSLVAYDKAGKAKGHAWIYGDSIDVFKDSLCVFSGTMFDYIVKSREELFFVIERGEIKTESDILFLLVSKEMIVFENKTVPYRRPTKEELPGNFYFLFFYD